MNTERDIQKQLVNQYGQFYKLFCPNIFLYKWESDLIGINNLNEVVEFEVKCSRHDYLNDAKKVEKHEILHRMEDIENLPNKFYYVFGDGIKLDIEVPEYAGVYIVDRAGMHKYLREVKKAPILHREKMNSELWEKVAIKLFNKLY